MEKKRKKRVFNLHALRTKVIMSFLTIGIWAVAFHTYIYQQTLALSDQYTNEISFHKSGEQAATKLIGSLNESTLLLHAYLQNGDNSNILRWETIWNEEVPVYLNDFKETISALDQSTEGQRELRRLLISYELMEKNQKELIDRIQNNLKANEFYLAHNTTGTYNEAFLANLYEQRKAQLIERDLLFHDIQQKLAPTNQALIQDILLYQNQLRSIAEQHQLTFDRTTSNIKMALLAASALGFLIGFLMAYHIVKSTIMSIFGIKQAVKKLSTGSLPSYIESSKNEMNYIIRELNKLIDNLHQVKNFALKVGKGEFDNNISVFNKEGELGESLEDMKQSLSKVALEDKQRNWVNEGFAKFGDVLRTHNDNITELCDQVITKLVKYVDANQGAIFLIEEKSATEKVLSMEACYAYNRKKYLKKEVLKGEGLIGQAWQEQDTIFLTDVPDDYINIRSGLGDATPNCVIIVPLMSNEELVGVLELASFKTFGKHEIEFIHRVSETIASSVSATLTNERTVNLLQESQQMTEAMQAQEEEMRQSMEELQATQEEMYRAKLETERKEQNLKALINNTNDTIFAINRDYEITVVNDTLKNKYAKLGINLQLGTKMSELLKGEQWAYWKERYDRAMNGEAYTIIEERGEAENKIYVQTFHNPIKDQNGAVIGVSVISRDVTDLISAEKDAKRKEATLHAMINNTADATFFAINRRYEIIVVNKTLQDRYAAAGIDLQEGQNILEVIPEADRKIWKERYDRVLQGESFMIPQERKVADRTLYVEGYYQPIEDTDGKIRGAAVISKDITKYKEAIDAKMEQDAEIAKLRKALGMEDDIVEQIKKNAPSEDKKKDA